jgi:hypothetical protein
MSKITRAKKKTTWRYGSRGRACFVNMKSCVQTAVPPKKKKAFRSHAVINN